MKKPHVTSLKGRTFQVGKSETKRAALMVVDTDFVRRTIVGREETRDLRHCSRSGAYTYSKFTCSLSVANVTACRSPGIADFGLGPPIPQALDVRRPVDEHQLQTREKAIPSIISEPGVSLKFQVLTNAIFQYFPNTLLSSLVHFSAILFPLFRFRIFLNIRYCQTISNA